MIVANGFVLYASLTKDPKGELNIWFPGYEELTIYKRQLHPGVLFSAWQADEGDVIASTLEDNSFIILSGYIDSGHGLSAKAKQAAIVKSIEEKLSCENTKYILPDLASSLSGSFSLVIVQLNPFELFIATDKVASRPIWFGRTQSELCVSTHSLIVSQICGLREYRPGGLASYLLYGTQIHPSKSLFKGIYSAQEGAVTHLTADGHFKVTHYYRFRHRPEMRTRKELVEIGARGLIKAASRLAEEEREVGLFLSGGVDSRLIACSLTSAGIRPLAITLADCENIETKVARKVSEQLGLRHELILRDPEWYLRTIADSVFEAGGVYDWTHAHFREACKYITHQFGPLVFMLGDFAEAFSKLLSAVDSRSTYLWTDKEFVEKFDSLMLPLYRPKDRNRTVKLLRTEFWKIAEREVREDIVSRYQEIRTCSNNPAIIVDQFFRWQNVQSSPTYEMQLSIRSTACERNIMLNTELHHLREILPASVRDRDNYGVEIMHKLNKKAAHIVNSNTLVPACWHPTIHMLAKEIRPLVGKAMRKLRGHDYKNQGAWPSKAILYLKHPAWQKEIRSVLFERMSFDSSVFNVDMIEKCWAAFAAGDLTRQSDVERLVSIGIMNKIISKVSRL